jgi:hypothetical protein
MTEFSVRLANRPGQLAALARILADANVQIEAFAAVGDDGSSHVRFIVDAAPLARRALGAAGMDFVEREVLDTFLPRGSGSLAHTAESLARAGVNIDSMYLLHTNSQGFHFAVTVDDTDAASGALAS